MGRVTNEQIYDEVQVLRGEVSALKIEVTALKIDTALLKSQSNEQAGNWDKVMQFGIAILQGIILWKLFNGT